MKAFALILAIGLCAAAAFAQKLVSPVIGNYRLADTDLIAIVKAEDARDPAPVNAMLTNVNAAVRYRSALAAGRIGSETSLDGLIKLLNDDNADIGAMAAFAIGEIESIKGADAILTALRTDTIYSPGKPATLTLKPMNRVARLVEAAGKIAAANAAAPKAKELGKEIIRCLEEQHSSRLGSDRTTTLLPLTAALRARPEGAAPVVAKFIDSKDARVRADALNTLTRLRAKERLADIHWLLQGEKDPIVRANAIRALAGGDFKDAPNDILNAALNDSDSRVRVAAIRALNTLKIVDSVDRLVERGRVLLREWPATGAKTLPAVKSELLEIATALGGLVPNSKKPSVWKFLEELRYVDRHYSAEIEVAMAKIDPAAFIETKDIGGVHMVRGATRPSFDWKVASNWHTALGEYAALPAGNFMRRQRAQYKLAAFLNDPIHQFKEADPVTAYPAIPSTLNAYARFKPAKLNEVLLKYLKHPDAFVRAAAAGTIADQPVTTANVDALLAAFARSYIIDKHDNDALLAILDAAYKLDKKRSVGILLNALISPDYLVRKKAFDLLADKELQKDFPGIEFSLASARNEHRDQVRPFTPIWATKLGQVLNTDADYRRALSRKNGSIKAVLTTDKGTFTILFNPEEAPLTVDNFVKLARSGYFNGLEVHRVVPNFVMQDGDPRGDGSGGPGWSIRCEVNMLGYDRGAVGMALSGKDTGGSQWFVTHSQQPHLDGGYTVFGHVSDQDMKVVDKIVRGDRILRVRVVGR